MNDYNRAFAERVLERHENMRRVKQPWLSVWQRLSEYLFFRRVNFYNGAKDGPFSIATIFDATAPRSASIAAGAIASALFPSAKRSIKLKPSDNIPEEIRELERVKKFYQNMQTQTVRSFSNPKAGFDSAKGEYMLEQVGYGTSGLLPIRTYNKKLPVVFKSLETKSLFIDEGANGQIDVVHIERHLTPRQVVQEFGEENVSEKVAKAARSSEQSAMYDKVCVVQCIGPREVYGNSFGNIDMPFYSVHVEKESKHIIEVSGFEENPAKIGRFIKVNGEVYGRSLGLETLAEILEINVMRESLMLAIEKILDPPIAVTHDGVSGGGKIRTGPRDINVRQLSGRIPDALAKWIEPIFTVGDIKPAKERIAEIQEVIAQGFMLDRLLDLNNENRMTLGEANIRDRLRGQALALYFARQIEEVFTPLVERVVNILWAEGLLGVIPGSMEELYLLQEGIEPMLIPDEILEYIERGEDFYEIEYISPAARIVRSEELMGINQVVAGFAEISASGNPGVWDVIKLDRLAKRIVELSAAPEDIVAALEEIEQVRQQRAESQAALQEVDLAHRQAQANRANAQAAESAAKAGQALPADPTALPPQQGVFI